MPISDRTIYEFGDFRLDPAENLLLKAGEPVALKLKAFSTLVFLVENRGRLVEKAELMDEVWGDSFVEEAAISKCIWTVRAALGDSGKKEFIQTVPKRGYRFVGEVDLVLPPAENPVSAKLFSKPALSASLNNSSGIYTGANFVSQEHLLEGEEPSTTHDEGRERSHSLAQQPSAWPTRISDSLKNVIGLIVAALVIASGFVLYQYDAANSITASSAVRKIAVLPLKPVDVEKRDRGIEFAIADALILKLSESKAFEVNRLNTIRKFIDVEDDPVDAGRELQVDYVLSSNYQIVDGRIRVTSQLLNVQTGSTEQTFRSETESKSVFDIQDAVANDIGNAVFSNFGTPASIFAARRGTENEEAYSLYQQAWYLIDKGTAEESEKAARLLDRAVELDPNYSQAWAVRSHAYCQFAHQGGGEPLSVFTTAEPMLERSMLLDANNAMAYTIRGTINRDFHWNLPQAISDLKRAVELDSSLVLAHRVLAGAYYRNGQFEEALESEKRAVDLHPTSLADHWFLGHYLVAAGRKQEGIAQLNRVVEMNPSYPPVYQSLWEIYHFDGNHPKAYENFIRLKEAYAVPQNEIESYKHSYEKAGWPGVLRKELEWVQSKEPKGRYCNYKYYIAAFAALSGDSDLAFYYLDEAIRYRLISVSFLKVDPKFESLRKDPRFDAVINRTGLARS